MALQAPSLYGGKIWVSVYDVLTEAGFTEELLKSLSDPQILNKVEQEIRILDNKLSELQSEWSLYKTLASQSGFQGIDEASFLSAQHYSYNLLDSWAKEYAPSVYLEQQGKDLQYEAIKNKISKLIWDLYEQEQVILSLLNKNSQTTEYSIYFFGDGDKEVFRGTVSTEELHQHYGDMVYIADNGAVMLKKNIVEYLKSEEKSSLVNFNIYDEIIKIAIQEITEIRTKQEILRQLSSMEHLGDQRDNQYDAGLAVEFSEQDIMALYARYAGIAIETIRKTDPNSQNRVWSQIYAAINRGHIAEAYERYYQSDFDSETIQPEVLKGFLAESLGNDPWYSRGDVNATQVKSFFDSQDRRMASLSSIISLATSLSILLKKGIKEYKEIMKPSTKSIKAMDQALATHREKMDAMASAMHTKVFQNAMKELENMMMRIGK